MAKGAWIGVGGKARKIKNMYIGIGGKARKIKKAWIGVGGKARLFFSSDQVLTYLKEITQSAAAPTANSRDMRHAVANGNHAMVMCRQKYADFFNASLTRSDIGFSSSSTQYGNQTACFTSSYNMIAGGGYSTSSNGSVDINELRAFNSSLTCTNGTLKVKISGVYSDTLNNYAFLCGGTQNRSGYSAYSSTTQIVNNSLTGQILSNLSTKKYRTSVRNLGNKYILVMGGRMGSGASSSDYTKTVDVYDTSLTKLSNATALPAIFISYSSVKNDNYVIYNGFVRSSSWGNQSVAYNNSLTQNTSVSALASTAVENATVSTEELGIFAGGRITNSSSASGLTANVECFNLSLTKTSGPALKTKRSQISGAYYKGYVMIFGGITGEYEKNDNYYNTYTNTVSVYTV